tara:strand:- start:134 stop:754 length:621 start_codon:yes stop_codon:yes gene_type:complete
MSIINDLNWTTFEDNNEYNDLYTITEEDTDEEKESVKENDSDEDMDKVLNKNICMIKSLSFDNRSCIICLAENKDETNKEPIVINNVCKSCSYYVHDSCFSNWYEKHNKCIICREKIDMTYDSDSDNRGNITPRRFNRLLNIINSGGIDIVGVVSPRDLLDSGFISHTRYNCRYLIINVIYITTLTSFFYIMIKGLISIDEIPGSI